MLNLLTVTAALLVPGGSHGFTAHPANQLTRLAAPTKPSIRTPTQVNSLPDSVTTFEDARGYFYLWFFGGQGGATVALAQAPAQIKKFRSLFDMSEEGPTQGGETVGVSPLCLYPRDLSTADLTKVLNNKLTVEKMVEKGPKPNYLSENGYLCYPSFVEANKGCNPLTIRAVFDAMCTSDNVSPEEAQTYLDEFKSDPSGAAFKNKLLKTKLTGYSSVAFLLFLLGPIVGSTCLDAAAAGWFPEWPGADNMPWSLVVPGAWTIPEYWI